MNVKKKKSNQEIQSVFSTYLEDEDNTLSNKMTYTMIMNSIPDNKLTKPLNNWIKNYSIEWRWRFIKSDDRYVVEISYVKDGTRYYFNNTCEWVERNIEDVNDCVVEEYYVYSN